MKGFGTVVTGTLISGTVHKEQELEVHPTGKRLRVRGVQVHGAAADEAIAGQRTALNLAGVETAELGARHDADAARNVSPDEARERHAWTCCARPSRCAIARAFTCIPSRRRPSRR